MSDLPVCRSAVKWTGKRLGKGSLAPLTGQDSRALSVFVHAVDLYLCSDGSGRGAAINAMRFALRAMQPKCWPIAKASIPAIGDWSHEEEIWMQIDEGSL